MTQFVSETFNVPAMFVTIQTEEDQDVAPLGRMLHVADA